MKGDKVTAKEKLIQIVLHAKGDDLERAERAFRGLTKEQLKEEYGRSGRTKGEVLAGYRKERREWEQAYVRAKRAQAQQQPPATRCGDSKIMS